MAILAALQSAAIRLLGRKPTSFFGASGTFELELCDFVNEVAEDIAKYRDWQALTRFATIAGDGTTKAFALPTDFDRMAQNADLAQSGAWFGTFTHVPDVNEFFAVSSPGYTLQPGAWTIYDNQMRFQPAPPTTPTASYPYITKNWAIDVSTAGKSAFTADTDQFELPERLLTLGLVYRWRENKKMDSTGDLEAFTKALDEYAAKDGGSRVIRRRAAPYYPGVRVAWPWALGGV